MPRDTSSILGYYLHDRDPKAAHDPGTDGMCVVCCKKLGPNDLSRIEFADDKPGSTRRMFFRVHRKCWLGLNEKEQVEYQVSLGMKS